MNALPCTGAVALPGAGAPFTASLDRRKMVYRGRGQQPPQRSRSASGTKIETSADASERGKDGRVADDHASSKYALGLSVAASYAETGSALVQSIGSLFVRRSVREER